MKKLLCLCMVLILSVSLLISCGNNDKTENDNAIVTNSEENAVNNETEIEETPKTDEVKTENEEKPVSSTPAKKPVKDNPADKPNQDISGTSEKPKAYIIIEGGTDESSICYHLEGCSELKNAKSQHMNWEMIETLAFRQCKVCKPPKYEGYIE